MSESPLIIAREAKNIHQSLKELLKVKEPFDKEVDFQRRNLRRLYLSLLLVHSYAKEAKDIEMHLWMQTSYAFIASYKQKISAMDRAMQGSGSNAVANSTLTTTTTGAGSRHPPAQNQRQSHANSNNNNNNHHPGPVEHRKLVQRFRQFLAEEEKFWTQLVVRLRRSFALNEAHPALVALGILSNTEETVSGAPEPPEARDGVIHTSYGRNQFQFPPEDAINPAPPSSQAERDSKLAIVSKALICLGDIARYRELYNESGGRPRAGHEESVPARRGRPRRGGVLADIPRPRNYDKAQQCYEQARLLVPYEGNPSHQLAILASYQKDAFASLVHYYRALCVRQPYETAADNLVTVLSKALEQWRNRMRREAEKPPNAADLPVRIRVEALKEKIVVLHALWRVALEKGVAEMDSISPKHAQSVYREFFALVSDRQLPTDFISRAIVLTQGALWKHRMIRDTAPTRTSAPSPATTTIVDARIYLHLLDFHKALLNVGRAELKEAPPLDAVEGDLAQRITATFRRTLPPLRIASKWLRANIKYVMQDPEFLAIKESESQQGKSVGEHVPGRINPCSVQTIKFWEAYTDFLRSLSRAFPADKLPALLSPLEEDIEMRGFLPLHKMMGEGNTALAERSDGAHGQHPNEEQLMRIADLLGDAQVIADVEGSPIERLDGSFVLAAPYRHRQSDNRDGTNQNGVTAARSEPWLRNDLGLVSGNKDRDDDNVTELTSKTDDDVVHAAFSFLNAPSHDEDDDDEIVWNPRASVSPVMAPSKSPTLHKSPITPVRPTLSPIGPSARSPTMNKVISPPNHHKNSPSVAPTTAQDLLNDFLGLSKPTHSAQPEFSAPQPPLLFGSELTHRPGTSIWSASVDEQPLRFAVNGNPPSHLQQTHSLQQHYPGNLPQDISGWSSPHLGSQHVQHHVASPSFSIQPGNAIHSVNAPHQRVPSSATVAAQLFPNFNHPNHDPFSYPTSSVQQQPIHRPETYSLPMASTNATSLGPIGSFNNLDAYRDQLAHPGYPHARHLSIHEQRAHHYPSASMSPIWGHPG